MGSQQIQIFTATCILTHSSMVSIHMTRLPSRPRLHSDRGRSQAQPSGPILFVLVPEIERIIARSNLSRQPQHGGSCLHAWASRHACAYANTSRAPLTAASSSSSWLPALPLSPTMPRHMRCGCNAKGRTCRRGSRWRASATHHGGGREIAGMPGPCNVPLPLPLLVLLGMRRLTWSGEDGEVRACGEDSACSGKDLVYGWLGAVRRA